MSQPADVMPVVERTTRSGFLVSFCPVVFLLPSAPPCWISEIALTMFLVPSWQISIFPNALRPPLRERSGTAPMQDRTMSTNRPSEVRRARLTELMSLMSPRIILRFDGASEMESRLRSLSGLRTRTVHCCEDLRQRRRMAKPVPPVEPKIDTVVI